MSHFIETCIACPPQHSLLQDRVLGKYCGIMVWALLLCSHCIGGGTPLFMLFLLLAAWRLVMHVWQMRAG